MERLKTQNYLGALRVVVSLIVVVYYGGIFWSIVIYDVMDFGEHEYETKFTVEFDFDLFSKIEQ